MVHVQMRLQNSWMSFPVLHLSGIQTHTQFLYTGSSQFKQQYIAPIFPQSLQHQICSPSFGFTNSGSAFMTSLARMMLSSLHLFLRVQSGGNDYTAGCVIGTTGFGATLHCRTK